MLRATLSGGQLLDPAILLGALLVSTSVTAAEGAAAVTPEQLKSSDWWLNSAAHWADAVEGTEAKNDVYWKLVYAQAWAGDLESAATSASRVTDPYRCVMSYAFVAKRYHERGDFEGCREALSKARQIATATKEAQTNNFIHSELIRDYVELGMPEEARSFAESLPPWWHRYLGLQDLASELAKQGELKQALEVARQVAPANLRESVLASVAIACAREGRIEDTQGVAAELTDAKGRDRAFRTLSEALAKAGRLDDAQQATAQITSPDEKAAAESALLSEWANGQEPAAIAARIAQVSTREEKLALYSKLVDKLAAGGKVDEAEKAIKAMVTVIKESPRPVVTSAFGQFGDSSAIATVKALYLPLARVLAKRGDQAEARRCIAQAEQSILQLPPQAGLTTSMLLMQLVTTQAEIGDLKGARHAVEEIKEGVPRSTAASALGPALVKAGDVPAALQVVALIDNLPSGKGTFLEPTVRELVRTGDIAAAKKVLADVGDSARDAEAYRAAGRTMLETHRSEELYQWLPDMPSNVARAFACIGAAQGLMPPTPDGS